MCSADACYSAGVEIATITEKYLAKSPKHSPVGNQYAFCLFVAGRVLLAHWRYTPDNQLPLEFWSLMQNLNEMSRRWTALSESSASKRNLFTMYATRLQQLYDLCATDEAYQINIMDYTIEIDDKHGFDGSAEASNWPEVTQDLSLDMPDMNMLPSPSNTIDFSAIPQIMLDQVFMDMDHVIAFDDGSMFSVAFDSAAGAW